MNNKPYLLALNHLQVNLKIIYKLLKTWPSLHDCFTAPRTMLQQLRLPHRLIDEIYTFPWDILKEDERFETVPDQTILTIDDKHYPSLLKEIHDPPPVLYAQGNLKLLHQPALAIVGSRHPSLSGRQIALEWAKQLSLHGLTIVSGLARGIDGAAHQGAVMGSGKTIAVLGSGLYKIYPAIHKTLASQIITKGLILSEFPLNTPPRSGHFPRRNRIISGLCQATFIVEAALKSGSLITARYALEQNRDVLALPGYIHLQQTQGCHHLLKQGAALVTHYQDILLELGLPISPPDPAMIRTTQQEEILDCIGTEPTHINTIHTKSRRPLSTVMQTLAQLEIMGSITAIDGGYKRLMR